MDGTSNLGCTLPDNLGKVGEFGVAGVIVRGFRYPAVDRVGDRIASGSSSQVFCVLRCKYCGYGDYNGRRASEWSKLSTRVLEYASRDPSLGGGFKVIAPG